MLSKVFPAFSRWLRGLHNPSVCRGEGKNLWWVPEVVPLLSGDRMCGYKSKGVPRQAEVAQGVPGRLRPRIISTFGATRVVGRQPYAPAAFTPGEIPGTHFQRLSRPQGTWFNRREPRKKSPVSSPGIGPRTVLPVAQRLNHYATPRPQNVWVYLW